MDDAMIKKGNEMKFVHIWMRKRWMVNFVKSVLGNFRNCMKKFVMSWDGIGIKFMKILKKTQGS